jgi:hypothetical protein
MGLTGSLLKYSAAKILRDLDLLFNPPPRPGPTGVIGVPRMSSVLEDKDDPNLD